MLGSRLNRLDVRAVEFVIRVLDALVAPVRWRCPPAEQACSTRRYACDPGPRGHRKHRHRPHPLLHLRFHRPSHHFDPTRRPLLTQAQELPTSSMRI